VRRNRDLVLPARFWVIWSGQIVTLLGNSALRFAFVIRVWASGGQATGVVLLTLWAMLPQLLLSPTAGALVDRCRKRTALQLADLCGLVAVAGLAAVYFGGQLRLWEIYVAVAAGGAATAFQYPALASAVPALVSERHYQRANGLLGSSQSIATICGPMLGALLIATSGLGLILWVDLATFVVALATVQFAAPEEPGKPGEQAAAGPRARRRLLADSAAGLSYLFARPSLRGLTLVMFAVNLVMVFGMAVLQPMVLARTGGDTSELAGVVSCMGIGGVAGGFLVGAWGGPKNRIRGMTLGIVGLCLSALIAMAVSRSMAGWCVAIFVGALLLPIINSAEQSLLQTKVPAGMQGKVFGASLFATQISAPLALAVAGPLADDVFDPHGAARGVLRLFQPLLGAGAGSGMAAMLLIAGIAGIGTAVAGMASRSVRDIDLLVPDLETGSLTAQPAH
jgi:MFS transporter, DHA3 family, macrolide efflux protein